MGLNVDDTDDTCRRRAKDGICETRSNDKHARTTMRTAISLWTQQATPASRPNCTHVLRKASVKLEREDQI